MTGSWIRNSLPSEDAVGINILIAEGHNPVLLTSQIIQLYEIMTGKNLNTKTKMNPTIKKDLGKAASLLSKANGNVAIAGEMFLCEGVRADEEVPSQDGSLSFFDDSSTTLRGASVKSICSDSTDSDLTVAETVDIKQPTHIEIPKTVVSNNPQDASMTNEQEQEQEEDPLSSDSEEEYLPEVTMPQLPDCLFTPAETILKFDRPIITEGHDILWERLCKSQDPETSERQQYKQCFGVVINSMHPFYCEDSERKTRIPVEHQLPRGRIITYFPDAIDRMHGCVQLLSTCTYVYRKDIVTIRDFKNLTVPLGFRKGSIVVTNDGLLCRVYNVVDAFHCCVTSREDPEGIIYPLNRLKPFSCPFRPQDCVQIKDSGKYGIVTHYGSVKLNVSHAACEIRVAVADVRDSVTTFRIDSISPLKLRSATLREANIMRMELKSTEDIKSLGFTQCMSPFIRKGATHAYVCSVTTSFQAVSYFTIRTRHMRESEEVWSSIEKVSLNVFKNVPSSLNMKATLTQKIWRPKRVDQFTLTPKGIPVTPDNSCNMKPLCSFTAREFNALTDEVMKLENLQLIEKCVTDRRFSDIFSEFLPVVSMISSGRISIKMTTITTKRPSNYSEVDSWTLDLLSMKGLIGQSFLRMNKTYPDHVDISFGDCEMLLKWDPPLIEKDPKTSPHLYKALFLDNRKEFISYIRTLPELKISCPDINNTVYANGPVENLTWDVRCLQIYADVSNRFYDPSRLYNSSDLGARQLMNIVLGKLYGLVYNELSPHPSMGVYHKYEPFISDFLNAETANETLYLRPCITCGLPQVSHRACGAQSNQYVRANVENCALCGVHIEDHTAPSRKVTVRPKDHQNHPFVSYSELPARYLGNKTHECTTCNTQHLIRNQHWRDPLLRNHPERDRIVKKVYYHDSQREEGVKRDHNLSLNLAVAVVNSDYKSKYDIGMNNCNLRPYQEHAIDWMIKRETHKSKALVSYSPIRFADDSDTYYFSDVYGDFTDKPFSIKGGILASEMGMGKTIMILSLSHHNGPRAHGDYVPSKLRKKGFFLAAKSALKGKAAQSKKHISTVSDDDSDTEKRMAPLFTYQKKSMRRKLKNSESRIKRKDPPKSQGNIKRIKTEEPVQEINNDGRSVRHGMLTGGTLIITKASLRGQWSDELRSKLPNAHKYLIFDYHSGIPVATRNSLPLQDADFVVTNYDIISLQKSCEPDSRSTITNIWWNRIVFDECHFTNSDSSQSRLTVNLKGTNRWMLSGTPLQTNYTKISGLARTLYGIKPNDNMSLVLQTQLNRWLQSTTLRHTFGQVYADTGTKFLEELSQHSDVVVNVVLSERERLVYNTAQQKLSDELKYLTPRSPRWWAQWTVAAMRLRQLTSHVTNTVRNPFSLEYVIPATTVTTVAAHGVRASGSYGWNARVEPSEGAQQSSKIVIEKLPTLIPSNRITEVTETLQNPSDYECPICFESSTVLGLTKCGHLFCGPCIIPTVDIRGECPLCRAKVDQKCLTLVDAAEQEPEPEPEPEPVPSLEDANVDLDEEPAADADAETLFKWLKRKSISSKMNAMIKRITELRKKDPTCKFVIFTQFEATIKAIEREISKIGFESEKIIGSMSQKQRSNALTNFSIKSSCIAFLLTIRTGSCGLNLTTANHVFLMEPCLNPSLELQAIGRCQRITQTKQVVCHRFIVQNSIETVLHDARSGSKSGSNVSILTPAILSQYFGVSIP